MLLSPEFVLVKEITSNVSRSEFSESDLEQVARLILKAEGTIKPLVVRTIGWESYEVVDGHFEYYAALRAKEINPRDGERIGAFIIEGDKADVLEEQVKMLRNISPISEDFMKIPRNISPVSEAPTIQEEGTINLSNLDKLLDQKLQLITTKLDRLNTLSPTDYQSQGNNIIEQKLENIESKVNQLLPKTNITEIEEILNNKLEVIRQKISNLSKQEALDILAKTKTALNRYLEAIDRESNQLQRVNLLKVETEEEIQQAFQRNNIRGGTEAWKAIKYWRKPGKKLTWENLEKSAKTARKDHQDKIQGFAKGTYNNLKKIGYIPD
ncbi:MAG: hypothetical protein O4861_18025 [Trichodesmium sp. St16_bin4-tuft]|nr:hypothetical protein [Trichodesmium sp. St4_bin8_1]MDE5070721.1 hypothetical protein [Trichodesmium sp. St5_bin8]MDE5100124.1 hypothetical protein [Trichodesmium sp. St16_bin4-tuft]MDE5104689.1 hypothetical protein [Trichodesmium sp. St19_bin2]